MTRDELSPKAAEMLKAHNLDEVFVTSDAQGFTDLHRAETHAAYLKNKKVEHFTTSKEAIVSEIETDNSEDNNNKDRQELVAKYELLFGKKPNHNLGLEKLKTQISEKEKEISNTQVMQDTTQPASDSNPTEEEKDIKE